MLEKVRELLVEELQVNPDDVTMDADLSKDLGINSIELADLIMLCEEKFNIEISEDESSYALTFRATETLAQLLFSNAYESLYTDQASASDVVDSYETQTISGYIEISKYTGLPTVAGMEYTAAAAIEDADQRFHVRIEQEYSYGN